MTRKLAKDSPHSKRGSSSSRTSSSPAYSPELSPARPEWYCHLEEDVRLELSSRGLRSATASELQKLRLRHSRAIAKLILWTEQQGIELVLGEGYLMLDRRFRFPDGNLAKGQDAVHLRTGNHYRGLAIDCLLYIKGAYITDGGHALWRKIGQKWETLDPLARWGGHFGDANHLSFIYGGIR